MVPSYFYAALKSLRDVVNAPAVASSPRCEECEAENGWHRTACSRHFRFVTPVAATSGAREAALREAIAIIVGLPTEHYIYSGPYRMEASTFRDNAVKALEAALVVGRSKVPSAVPVEEQERPKIICLCGSTRFIEQFAIQTWELERQGFIVLGCTLLPMWYCNTPDHFGEVTGTKEQCDELHLRKIDLADQVLVLNIGGYIGESTAREIAYATTKGKPVHYVESDTIG